MTMVANARAKQCIADRQHSGNTRQQKARRAEEGGKDQRDALGRGPLLGWRRDATGETA